MKVSCICPTFNRVITGKPLLEEAIFSFIRQSYRDKELLVVNDCPYQKIIFSHPQVRIINLDKRFPSLGEKYNWAISQAEGELVCTWEDDDISLTNRLSNSVKHLAEFDYYNPRGYWFFTGGRLTWEHPMGYSHNCSIFRKKAFEECGGYPHISGPQDAHMDGLLRKRGNVSPHTTSRSPRDWDFIYRWGVSTLHLSGFADTNRVYREVGARSLKVGDFTIAPRWFKDYEAMVSECIEENAL